jgi:DNA-binding NarL/FixJ family response regulator
MLTAADELSFVEAVTNTRFDLVIADLSFPISSGGNLVQLLHRLNPGLMAIIVSVYDEPTVARECIAEGAKGIVLKRSSHRSAGGGRNRYNRWHLHLARC